MAPCISRAPFFIKTRGKNKNMLYEMKSVCERLKRLFVMFILRTR